MNCWRLTLFLSIIFSMNLLGQDYTCNIDYYEGISKYGNNQINMALTAIFFLKDCTDRKKTVYEERIGDFKIHITCNNNIEINVTQPENNFNEVIKLEDIGTRFFKTFIRARSGLKMSCQGRTIARTVVSDI